LLLERGGERREILVPDEHRDIANPVGSRFEESTRLFETSRLDVRMRALPEIPAKVTQERRRARERLGGDGGEVELGKEVSLDVAHRPPGHRIVRRKVGPLDSLPAVHRRGQDLHEDLPLEERERLGTFAPRQNAGENVLVGELIEPGRSAELGGLAEQLGHLRLRDLFLSGHRVDERWRRIQGQGVEDGAHRFVFVLHAARNDERRGAADGMRRRPEAGGPHFHDARAARQDDHRSIVSVDVLVEADTPFIGQAHRAREIDELVEEMSLGSPLEPLPLREGVIHVTILTK
jgi:hypothetical protein